MDHKILDKTGLPYRQEQIYGNCSVLHPDGTLMFRCDVDRINWYLDRDLAEVVSENPTVIRLTFWPRGKGHMGEPFYLSKKDNRCVVCGATEYLTRHHAVPHCYRRYFPEHLKSRSSHDVLPVCVACHEEYEKEAHNLKKEIAAKYNLPINGGGRVDDQPAREYSAARGAANALLKYSDVIPADKQLVLRARITSYLKKEPTDKDIEWLANIPRQGRASKHLGQEGLFSHGKAVVEKLEDVDEFVIMWRKHFVDTMNPKFLNKHWDVNHRVRTKWQNLKGVGIKVLVVTLIGRFAGWSLWTKLRRLFWASPKPADTNTPQDILK